MAAKNCDDCGKALPKRYKALDGRYLCTKCRELRAEAFDFILYELTHRTKQERLARAGRKVRIKLG